MKKTNVTMSVIVIVLLLATALPGVVLAAVEGTSTGSFTASNATPSVTSVALWTTGGGAAATDTMTPLVQYNVKVAVTDNNTLDDLSTVTVYLYHDADGTYDTGDRPGAGNTQTCAILTWAIVSGSYTAPTLTISSGTYEFNFTPGKVSTETPGAGE